MGDTRQSPCASVGATASGDRLSSSAPHGCDTTRGGAFDASTYISEEAAVCAAQVQGINLGADGCVAYWSEEVWEVYTTYNYVCTDDAGWGASATVWFLDAVTGQADPDKQGAVTWDGYGDCPYP
jgi:hypothetical protein